MPEQPPDPLHYDMRIPAVSDAKTAPDSTAKPKAQNREEDRNANSATEQTESSDEQSSSQSDRR